MRLGGFLSLLFCAAILAQSQIAWPVKDDGYTQAVQCFNAVSFYGNWGFHSASENTTDFESGAHDFTRLFTICKDIGLYILFRPGPYVNAETTGGGFPGWVETGAYGTLRNNDTRYTAAWTPYFTKISEIVAQHQVTNGGNVFIYQIENELGQQWTNVAAKTPNLNAIAYMEKLEKAARDSGIVVPLIHNNPNMRTKSWSQDYGAGFGGNVDIYALDHYPSCWSCDLSECSSTNGNVPDGTVYEYYTNFQTVAPTQPSFLAEFQGGSYLPWAGPEGGCIDNTGPNWVNVYYRHNIGQKVSAQNVYMAYGGTNWGGLPFPSVGTSYDYSAPISESRIVGAKYAETKLFGQFLRVARDLTKVDLIRNGTFYATDAAIFTSELRNPDTKGAFYVTIHTSSPSTAITPFKLHVTTSLGNLTIPQGNGSILLNGRQSKIIASDFPVGEKKLVYSTAEIFTVSTQDSKPLVVLWLPAGETGEFYLTGVNSSSLLKSDGCSGYSSKSTSSGVIVAWTQKTGSCVIEFNNGHRFVLIDRSAAYATWVPSTSNDPYTPENSTVVVHGPYLVRSVGMENHELKLTGDWSNTTALEVFAPSAISSVKFNGANVRVEKTTWGSLVGTLDASKDDTVSILSSLPKLDSWKAADGLPERLLEYDDSKWVLANRSSSPNTLLRPATYPVLYADEYGFHTGNLLWRGRFSSPSNSSSAPTGIYLSVIGGTSHGWSAYLNGVFIGSWLGTTKISRSNATLSFANATLSPAGKENVLFVIQDHMGHDETTGATNPRGIHNATLLGTGRNSTFSSWKVAGNAGGEANIDPVRGVFAEGGLHAERLGWHLPSFDDSQWNTSAPSTGLSTSGAIFYRTVVPLSIPPGLDVSLGLVLSSPAGTTVRAQVYVNGYMFGKYVPYIGNQVVFPVFPGILNYHGDNTIALSIWAQEHIGGSVGIKWTVLGAVASSFDPGFDAEYLRPAWGVEASGGDRKQYY
ncbi:glycoside hydrolase family protein [Venturia nashicola]|nr:glycoside hydrolase family protein [Venturia nashicola]